MKEFTKKLKIKGWKLKNIAARWQLTPRRLSQIAADPSTLHLDALSGLPGNPDDPHNYDDFEQLFAAQNIPEAASLILDAAIHNKWTDEQIRELTWSINSALVLAESTRRTNKKELQHES